jgi:MFS family permease
MTAGAPTSSRRSQPYPVADATAAMSRMEWKHDRKVRRGSLLRLLIAQALSSMGTSVTAVALAVMVFDLTGSVLHMGAVLAASTLPLVVMSFVGGALLDRFEARRLMVLSDIARAALIVLMPLAAVKSIALIYVIAAAVGSMSAVFNPSQVKLVGDLVDPARLVKANSYLSLARDGAELGGYLAGGALVVSLGYATTFFVDGASYALSAVLLLGLRAREVGEKSTTPLPVLLAQAPKALSTIWRRLELRTNLLFVVLPMIFLAMNMPNAYALALEVFDKGPTGFAAMEMITSVGWIIGGIFASRLNYRGDKNTYVFWSIVAMAVCYGGVAISSSFWISVGLLALAAIANVGLIVGSMSLFQSIEPRPDKGRIIAVRAGFGQMAVAAGVFLGGVLGAAIGVRPSFLLAAVGAVATCAVIFLPYRVSLANRRTAAIEEGA